METLPAEVIEDVSLGKSILSTWVKRIILHPEDRDMSTRTPDVYMVFG